MSSSLPVSLHQRSEKAPSERIANQGLLREHLSALVRRRLPAGNETGERGPSPPDKIDGKGKGTFLLEPRRIALSEAEE